MESTVGHLPLGLHDLIRAIGLLQEEAAGHGARLFYVKGGAAVTGDKSEAFSGATGALLASANETRWGGTVGAGLEFGFAPNWSVGFEYDHLFMGSRDVTLTGPLVSEPQRKSA